MPVYQYHCDRFPAVVELVRPIEQRDEPVHSLIQGYDPEREEVEVLFPENGQTVRFSCDKDGLFDPIVLKRRTVPERVLVSGHAENPQSKETPLDGFRQFEEQHGGPATAHTFKEFGSLDRIKKIWSDPTPNWDGVGV